MEPVPKTFVSVYQRNNEAPVHTATSPDLLPGLCPWTPLGDFVPRSPTAVDRNVYAARVNVRTKRRNRRIDRQMPDRHMYDPASGIKLEFHGADTDTDILLRILADTSDTRNFLKLSLWQAERHADILATILLR